MNVPRCYHNKVLNLYAFGALHTQSRLIESTAHDLSDNHQSATYRTVTIHNILIGIAFIIGGIGLFYSLPSSASIITASISKSTGNSQQMTILQPNYSVEIPKAIGGPDDIQINNRLALLSPQVSIASGIVSLKNIEIDPDGVVTYIIQKGDTLSEIAEKFDVSINTIKWENNLGKTIKPGKELKILPLTGVRHTIRKGDTFSKIANLYDVEIEDITIFNNIDTTKLIPGKKIIIPNGVKKSVSRKSVSKKSSKVSSAPIQNGYYIRPTAGTLTSKFGPRWGKYHYGLDIAAQRGTPVVATASGTVVKTNCGSGYGICLVVQHPNGTQSLYAHNSKLYVTKGQKVVQGQKIAAIGSTGRSTGPHVHFEVTKSNGKKLNLNYLY